MNRACQQIAHQRIQRGVMTLRVGPACRERFFIERQGDILHSTFYVYTCYVSMSAFGEGVRCYFARARARARARVADAGQFVITIS